MFAENLRQTRQNPASCSFRETDFPPSLLTPLSKVMLCNQSLFDLPLPEDEVPKLKLTFGDVKKGTISHDFGLKAFAFVSVHPMNICLLYCDKCGYGSRMEAFRVV